MTQKHLIIYGRVSSKKNSKRIMCRGGKPVVLPSVAFGKFRENALAQLAGCGVRFGAKLVFVWYEFRLKGRADIDVDNAAGSVSDILQESGIFADDAQIITMVPRKVRGCDEWSTKIVIDANDGTLAQRFSAMLDEVFEDNKFLK